MKASDVPKPICTLCGGRRQLVSPDRKYLIAICPKCDRAP